MNEPVEGEQIYTWTEEKNRTNKKKHGFYLSDIVSVFDDPYLLEFYDVDHSFFGEDRYAVLGCFHNTTILFVVHTDNENGTIQLISARQATPKEKEAYNEQYGKNTYSGGN